MMPMISRHQRSQQPPSIRLPEETSQDAPGCSGRRVGGRGVDVVLRDDRGGTKTLSELI